MDASTQRAFSRRQFLALAGVTGAGIIGAGMFGCSGGSQAASGAAASSAAAGASQAGASAASAGIDYANWDAVLEAAKGQTVTWYGWGGSEPRNKWINDVLVPRLKEKYDVTLDLVGMDINDILTQLSGEMQANVAEGTIGFIWINGENFYSARENGYLWGPFNEYLPNFNSYIDATAAEVLYDFGSPIDGYETPYTKAQMQMWVDGDKVADPPKNPDEFLEFCKQNAGKVTYPQPGDFTGTAFIETLIAGVVGKESFEQLAQLSDPTEEQVKAIIDPGLEYLRQLNPYLWKEGKNFPADSTTLATMYADGEVVLNMGYGDPQADVDNGTLPASTKSFVFETGTVGNSNFMAIATNAPAKEAAMVAINEVISPEMQLDIYKTLGSMSVLDMSKLSDDERKAFEEVEPKSAQLPIAELLGARVAEASGPCVPVIEKLWLDEVVGK